MLELTREDVEKCCNKYKEYCSAKADIYKVFVQDEYLKYFSDPNEVFYKDGKYGEMAEKFKSQILMLLKRGIRDSGLLADLCRRYHRTENSVTVAYEMISDEEIEKLTADEIINIWMAETYHERWGGAFGALFNDPFFIKSLKRLKILLED